MELIELKSPVFENVEVKFKKLFFALIYKNMIY